MQREIEVIASDPIDGAVQHAGDGRDRDCASPAGEIAQRECQAEAVDQARRDILPARGIRVGFGLQAVGELAVVEPDRCDGVERHEHANGCPRRRRPTLVAQQVSRHPVSAERRRPQPRRASVGKPEVQRGVATIVCPGYQELQELLRSSVDRSLGRLIEVVRVDTSVDPDWSRLDTDLVLSTIPVAGADERIVRIAAIRGATIELPHEAERNTAGAALLALRNALGLPFGFEIEIDKGIAFGSGMGGSAASAVAALVAANALLDAPLERAALYPFALAGEAVASGGRHGDNVGPMLLGGLVLATADRLVPIPVPRDLHCALVHPHATLETKHARAALAGPYELREFVAQGANLALVLAGCHANDLGLIRAGLADVLVEPRRAPLIEGFAQVKAAALNNDALGASISGAGPSLFAWCDGADAAHACAQAMCDAFARAGVASEAWVSPVAGPAAEVVA